MRLDVVTIFPQYLAPLDLSLIGKARRDGLLDLRVHDLRGFTHDRHHTVDDTPYGGGAGMVMKPQPWAEAFDAVLGEAPGEGASPRARLVVPGPGGAPFTQATAHRLAREEHLVFACGRYEGIDERVYDHARDVFEGRVEILSLGDYVLNGGEVAVLAMVEAIARLVPGVVGNAESLVEESHEDGLLEYPVYTKPASWEGRDVPSVLLGGDHGAIARWRHEQRLARTAARRPDLLPPSAVLSGEAELPITTATPADAGELLVLRRCCLPEVAGEETIEDVRATLAAGAPWRTWTVRDPQGRLVAAVRGRTRHDDPSGEAGPTAWEIDGLVVAPDVAGRGIGGALLDHALAQADPEARFARIDVPRRGSRPCRLYRNAGFRPARSAATEPGTVVLTRSLRRGA
ncbi:tRNA (guanosine(37)-N1)-methyltransferase TrmD [Mobilicoccus pelagius]|uniref:tRNA (guanine-N(1)-)-methyltransferase n=1 Tax=Mobilicoccus pelagius NBRC 104925 TaxID=1089455 RepID=H5UNB0_9MICO|nr:tRNA (guanosine(37)-N1)-methyltransferase TrmD [Mobilicoccus pelagius]GAB47218.1 tRNA (guanine-N(1)-)-methyltransferase [Mobilicoccus pelagius NBRC 104925]